jgi:murein DD-endopeptidase MepM/ murein hydrolase activator NlpD
MEVGRKQKNKGFLTKSWVIRLVSHDARHTRLIRLKPMHFILTITLITSCILGIMHYNTARAQEKEQALTALQDSTAKQGMIIDRLKVEKKQISSLLEKQNHEIATKLEKIEKKNNEVRKIVGLKSEPISKKRSMRGSRGGSVNLLRLRTDFRVLSHAVNETKAEVDELETKAIAYKKEQERERLVRMLESVPSMWPASGPIVSEFGMRIHPIYGYERFHSGIDISAGYGNPIYSTAYGKVTYSGYYSGYGYTVMVNHGNGIQTLYGHCSMLLVKEGETVKKGQLVAKIGSTGISTGPHLHYEVQLAGTPTDPEPYLDYTNSRLANLKKRFGIN